MICISFIRTVSAISDTATGWLTKVQRTSSCPSILGKLATPLMNKVGKSPLTFAKSFSVTGCLLLVFWRHIARSQRYLTENRCTSNKILHKSSSHYLFFHTLPPLRFIVRSSPLPRGRTEQVADLYRGWLPANPPSKVNNVLIYFTGRNRGDS